MTLESNPKIVTEVMKTEFPNHVKVSSTVSHDSSAEDFLCLWFFGHTFREDFDITSVDKPHWAQYFDMIIDHRIRNNVLSGFSSNSWSSQRVPAVFL